MASALASLARWTKAAKSWLATGYRAAPMISPPASLKPLWNAASPSCPGPKSETIVYAFRMPLLYAQVPSVWFNCGTVNDVRTMQGSFLLMLRGHAIRVTLAFPRGAPPAAGRGGVGGEAKPRQQFDAAAYDPLLREPFGDVRCNPAGILADQLDLLAGNRVAVLLHVELDAVVH